ncbi:copper amine oxidase N-terminal domain-containing protein [Pelotomaculum schinkii]|nr:copper amine oxidase N-terminal domain-containing protein [Pelotomaculum schinkii]
MNCGFQSAVFGNTVTEAPEPAKVKILLDGETISFDEQPVMLNNRVLVPLREVAERMGADVAWSEAGRIAVSKDDTGVLLTVGKDTVYVNRQKFFMDQVPVLLNGRTFVPVRFVAPALGAKVDWDEANQTVLILSEGNFSDSFQSTEKYYKLFDVKVGGQDYCSPEEAKQYVLQQNLLKYAENIRVVYIRFAEYGPADTMVTGYDWEGNSKAVWLSKDPYLETIEVDGSVLLQDGVSEEKIYAILQEKGVKREDVTDLYLAINNKELNQICWYALVQQEQKKYNYLFDFKTGELISEYQYEVEGNVSYSITKKQHPLYSCFSL